MAYKRIYEVLQKEVLSGRNEELNIPDASIQQLGPVIRFYLLDRFIDV